MQQRQNNLTLPGAKQILLTAVAVRLMVDAGVQIVWPYLPIMARGLGISVAAIGLLLSLRGLLGLSSPLFGTLTDRLGTRRLMMIGLLLIAISNGMLAAGAQIALTALAFALMGIGLAIFVPALQAYISNQLAYQVRGRVLGAVEFSWALAGIAMLPLFGVLIEAVNWRAPFWILMLGALGGIPAILRLPEGHIPPKPAHILSPGQIWHGMTNVLLGNRSGLASVSVTFCVYLAAMNVIFIYGAWLEQQFGLSAAQLGLVATVLGLADLCGSGLSSMIVDRVGKRRVVLAGICWMVLAFLFLQLGDRSFLFAVAGLIAVRFGFEITLVSNISVISEQAPTQRAAMLSWGMFAGSLATGLGGLTASNLWLWRGIQANAIFSGLLVLLALFLGLRFVVERHLQPQPSAENPSSL